MFIWNGKKLAFNFLDADMMKKFSDAGKEMWKKLEEYEEKNVKDGMMGPEGVANESEIISAFFDEVFGNGTADEIFTSKHDLTERTKAIKKLYSIRDSQLAGHTKRVNDLHKMIGAE
ncbi:MAG: DUF6673 family protein [Anaerostipes hadrus]|nr:DUF6673 family protein [Anaerostipes hadrus]